MIYELTHPLATFERATDGSAGYDLRACIDEALTLLPNRVVLVPTGVRLDMMPTNYFAYLCPRSGQGHKRGLVLGNLTGIIDNDYTKEIFVSLWNRSAEPQTIEPGERIAQLVFDVMTHPPLTLGSVDDNDRCGFGSTGYK